MKKSFLFIVTIICISGTSMAGNCNTHQQVTITGSEPVLLLQIGDMKLMKYTNGGMVLYRVKKYSGETVVEDQDRGQLAARFPEMARNLEG